MAEKSGERGWKRRQLTLRLPPERLAQLRSIATQMNSDATPTDAVDRAIAMAVAQIGSDRHGDRLDAIEDALEALAMERRFDTDRIEAAVLALGKNLAALHALISEVANQAPEDY